MVPMPSQPTPPETDRPVEEACEWMARLQSGEVTEADWRAFFAWRNASLANEQAWRGVERTWLGIEPLRGRPYLPGSRPLSQESRTRQSRFATCTSHARRRRGLSGLAVACTVLLVVMFFAHYRLAYWQADYRTEKGERQAQWLSDGSKITLNTASAVAIEFDGASRHVRLLEGEAYFEVAKDATHPFVVSTEDGSVTAVGTAFSVQRLDTQLRVELVEGIVDVEGRHRHQPIRLEAGQVAMIGPDAVHVEPPSRKDDLAVWREGYLQFDGMRLREAVEQINRYRPGRVFVLNPRLADYRISGIFRLDALDQAVDAFAAAVPGLQKNTATPYLVFLR